MALLVQWHGTAETPHEATGMVWCEQVGRRLTFIHASISNRRDHLHGAPTNPNSVIGVSLRLAQQDSLVSRSLAWAVGTQDLTLQICDGYIVLAHVRTICMYLGIAP